MVETAKNTPKRKRSKRGQAFTQIVLLIGIALAINVIAGIYYARLDLTSDKRYTLGQPTKKLLKGLKDVVFVKVYLEGKDLPPGFKRLSESTRELLDEFRAISGDKIQYQFIDPDDLPDQKTKQNLYEQLSNQGLHPIQLQENKEDKISEQIVIPGAIVTYNNKDMPVQLLQEQLGGVPPDLVLHNSIIGLEYQLTNAIHKLEEEKKPKIAIIQGHGELKPLELTDIYNTLLQSYDVDFVDLPKYKVGRLDPYDAIIIAKPDSFFNELEKYKIDQFMMKGGKVLWFYESLNANMDSLHNGVGYTYDYKTNLEDMLFKYGIRVNYDLVQDMNCNYIPLLSPYGTVQKRNLLKWPYYPVVEPQSQNPIVHNLSTIWFQFASTIDTLHTRANPDIKKTILLQTSPFTRVMMNPVRIDLSLVSTLRRDEMLYRQGQKNLAVLLEGEFNSSFRDHPPSPETQASGQYGVYKERSPYTKMILVSDGDIIRNEVRKSTGEPFPLGFDPYSNQTFGNKTFVMNCVDYLVDESGLITLRAKDIKYRPLDNGRVKTERLNWQLLNMVVPVVAIVLFGLIFNYVRKRRFAS
jgi:ABC-2 type transport system permease protein